MPLRPEPTVGQPVDDALRRAILRWFTENTYITDWQIWSAYLGSFGCTEIWELAHRLGTRYDAVAAEVFRTQVERVAGRYNFGAFAKVADQLFSKSAAALGDNVRGVLPVIGLRALPDVEFLMALEQAFELADEYEEAREAATRKVNKLFDTLGVSYRYVVVSADRRGEGVSEFQRRIDPELEARVVAPALRALTDPRLASAAENYRDGLRRVVKPDGKELDDAVRDFGRAVQEALFVLATALGKRVKGAMAAPLYDLLKSSPLGTDMEALVLATSKIRNPTEHQRGELLNVQHATAEAAMGSAAVAITYIASFLPPGNLLDESLAHGDFEAAASPASMPAPESPAAADPLDLTVTEGDFRDFRSAPADDDIPF